MVHSRWILTLQKFHLANSRNNLHHQQVPQLVVVVVAVEVVLVGIVVEVVTMMIVVGVWVQQL